MKFDSEILFDPSISDEALHEQLEAFLSAGYSGSQLIHLIFSHPRRGVAHHVSRILETLAAISPKEDQEQDVEYS